MEAKHIHFTPKNSTYNTLRPRQNCCHFSDDIFKCIFLNETVWIALKISLKFVPMVRINNIPALVQIWFGANQVTSHNLNQWWLNYWGIYTSLGLNELTCRVHISDPNLVISVPDDILAPNGARPSTGIVTQCQNCILNVHLLISEFYWRVVDQPTFFKMVLIRSFKIRCFKIRCFSKINTLRPKWNGCHFAPNIFKSIFLCEKMLYFDSNFIEICSWGSN